MQYINSNLASYSLPRQNQMVFSMPKNSPSVVNTQNTIANRVSTSISMIPASSNFPGQYVNTTANLGTYRRSSPFITNTAPIVETPLPGPPTGKLRWGPPVWNLFHTLAEKVKPEYFPIVKTGLLNIINMICVNLPCPDCANHATEYMKGVNFNVIQTKDDVKNMLFRFHNSVNARRGVPLFDYAELTPKYFAANTSVVIQTFMEVFAKKNYSVQLMANDFHKTRTITEIKQWLANYLQYFDP